MALFPVFRVESRFCVGFDWVGVSACHGLGVSPERRHSCLCPRPRALTKVWTLRGVGPMVPAAGVNKRLCFSGALNYRSGQVHYLVHPKKNA